MNRPFQQSSIIGEYRVVDYLGEGGMGQVYRAVHSKINRVVAIKALTNAGHSLGSIERFLNEACIQARLQHPNIATLYDFVECEGQHCIIMEYVDGQTLAERIQELGRLPLHEALHVLQKIGEALEYIHENGIVHRDIKSNNVKITSRWQVKLLDFGIARAESGQTMTQVGMVIGTPIYLSPEQLRGERADARSDIWALGVLFYEMLTGDMPFKAETFGELYERITAGAYPPPASLNRTVPRGAEAVIARCLKKNAAERYQTVRELLSDARRLAATAPTVTTDDPPAPPASDDRPADGEVVAAPSWARRNWLSLTAGGAVAAIALLVAAGLGLLFYMDTPANDNAKAPPAATRPAATQSNLGPKAAGAPATRPVQITTTDGKPAEVYEIDRGTRELRHLGQTPYNYEGRFGDKVKLVLKREGFTDKPIEFDVRDSDQPWTVTMETKK
jgi:serine/threonine-protein kinase